ncbi:hypothetical protein KI387_007419 [Taxus chinensis]|uniref:Uncharacterized protein n=1 Tax=Taxus chinensis TaxID=29808 RepID=A0AA38GR27_TAXCH|nr:hypothetical protein KI387_007419 [Taxus chinensis]
MEKKAEILELLEIDYCSMISENKEITGKVMGALGPNGPGLLAITGVPNVQLLRNTLLPFARKIALMDDTQRRHILKVLVVPGNFLGSSEMPGLSEMVVWYVYFGLENDIP